MLKLLIVAISFFCCNSALQASFNEELESKSESYSSTKKHTLPPEIFLQIASYLPLPDLKSFRLVCREWLSIGSNTSLNIAKTHAKETTVLEDLAYRSERPKIQIVKFKTGISADLIEKYVKEASWLRKIIGLDSSAFTSTLDQLARKKGIYLDIIFFQPSSFIALPNILMGEVYAYKRMNIFTYNLSPF